MGRIGQKSEWIGRHKGKTDERSSGFYLQTSKMLRKNQSKDKETV